MMCRAADRGLDNMPQYRFEFPRGSCSPVYVDLESDDVARLEAQQALAEDVLDQEASVGH